MLYLSSILVSQVKPRGSPAPTPPPDELRCSAEPTIAVCIAILLTILPLALMSICETY